MAERKVGDFLQSLAAPTMNAGPAPDPAAALQRVEEMGAVAAGAPPIDPEAIKQAAGAPQAIAVNEEQLRAAKEAGETPIEPSQPPAQQPQQPQVDPMLLKEIEIINLKLQLAEAEEQLHVKMVQEARQQRNKLMQIQRGLVARVRGQVVVGPSGTPQIAPR